MNVWLTIFFAGSMLGLLPAYVASKRGRNFRAWWFYGTLLFVVAMPWALMLKPDRKALDRRALAGGDSRKCPSCAEIIKAEAVVCRFCGREVPTEQDLGEPIVAALVRPRR